MHCTDTQTSKQTNNQMNKAYQVVIPNTFFVTCIMQDKSFTDMMYYYCQNWGSWECWFPSTVLPQSRFKWRVFV